MTTKLAVYRFGCSSMVTPQNATLLTSSHRLSWNSHRIRY